MRRALQKRRRSLETGSSVADFPCRIVIALLVKISLPFVLLGPLSSAEVPAASSGTPAVAEDDAKPDSAPTAGEGDAALTGSANDAAVKASEDDPAEVAALQAKLAGLRSELRKLGNEKRTSLVSVLEDAKGLQKQLEDAEQGTGDPPEPDVLKAQMEKLAASLGAMTGTQGEEPPGMEQALDQALGRLKMMRPAFGSREGPLKRDRLHACGLMAARSWPTETLPISADDLGNGSSDPKADGGDADRQETDNKNLSGSTLVRRFADNDEHISIKHLAKTSLFKGVTICVAELADSELEEFTKGEGFSNESMLALPARLAERLEGKRGGEWEGRVFQLGFDRQKWKTLRRVMKAHLDGPEPTVVEDDVETNPPERPAQVSSPANGFSGGAWLLVSAGVLFGGGGFLLQRLLKGRGGEVKTRKEKKRK